MAAAVTRIMFHRGTEETSPILREIILKTSNYGGPYMQCTNIFFQCTTYIYSVHKCISECTNLFLSAQINFSVHKLIFQCTNLFLSAQMYFSVHKCDSQCTIVFSQNKCIFSAQMYFSVHKCISQCTIIFLSAWLHGFPCISVAQLGHFALVICLANRSAFENILIPHWKTCFVLAVALKCKFPFHSVLVVAGALKVIMTQIAFHVWRTSVGRLLLSTPENVLPVLY